MPWRTQPDDVGPIITNTLFEPLLDQAVKTNAPAFIPFANMVGKSEQENNLTERFNSRGIVTVVGRGQHDM